MLPNAFTPENLVLAVAKDDANVGAITVTIDHVRYP
jgi:hypothetical protein